MRLNIFALFVVFLFLTISANSQIVNEAQSSIILNEKSAEVSLVVESSSQSQEKISLELLDPKGVVQSQTSVLQQLKSGKETYKLHIPLNNLMQTNENEIAWFRLRYQIGDASGIISLNQIIKDIFEIRVIASENLFSGMTYRSRIRALNPFTNQAVEGVKVNAELVLDLKDDDEKKLKLNTDGETDSEGFANLDFQIPLDANIDDAEINVTGKKNGVIREANQDLSTSDDDYNFPMLTDKPIYQPEQMLNVRGILLKGTEGKVVVPNSEVEFRIEDEEDTVLYREKVMTSEYGIAAISWKIPENAKLGKYRIRVKNQYSGEYSYVGYQVIKVSRYDLPNFAVSAKTLKPFYLPDETSAEVEVNADYLFGKPVTKGKVHVVRENERKWNYKEQKYDIDEGESHEGNTDESGKYTVTFDLSEDHEELKDDDYRKFRDLNFTAYFTDLTTNRTEQRRFDVRVTREPIHVYFIGNRDDKNPILPINAYITTFYADGSPCQCDVELKGREENGDDEKYRTIQKVKTNSYGVGKVKFYRPKFEDADDDDDLEIEIIAKDKNNLKGIFGGKNYDRYDDDINFDDDDALQIQTERAIFKSGEAIKIKLNSNKQTGLVYVDVVKDWSVVESYFVNLKNGKAELKIPYNPKFQGVLKLAAYFEVSKMGYNFRTQKYDEEYLDFVKTSRGIIFPTQENLQVSANFDKETYKPSEEAKVNFSVLDSVGQAINSALGVVIFDKAVEERARTDNEFSGMFANFYGWLGYGDSLAGVNVKDLNSLDLTKPITDELQIVAEAMLFDNYYYPNVFRSRKTETDAKSVYAEYFKKQFEPIEKKLAEHYKTRNYVHPNDDASLRKILNLYEINFDDLRDPWGTKYRAVFEVDKVNDILRIVSAGADKIFDTKDDFIISSSSFVYFTPTGNAINKAVTEFHKRTGAYIRDQQTLFTELGITELKDRFGRPYHFDFGVSGRNYLISIRSIGKDGIFEKYYYQGDDFQVYSNLQDYFGQTDVKISQILQSAKKLPKTLEEFVKLLKENDLELHKIRDGYGENVNLIKYQFSKYTDKVVTENVQKYGEEKTTQHTKIIPVTQEIIQFTLRSKGYDRTAKTNDDFTLVQFSLIVSEQSKDDKQPVIQKNVFIDGTGSVQGIVTDSSGAIIPGATVTTTNETSKTSKNTTTNEEGNYTLANLSAGNYSIRVNSAGFKSSVRTNVPVTANSITTVDFQLEISGTNAVVTVTAESSVINTTDSQLSTTVTETKIETLPLASRNMMQLVQLQPGATAQENEAEQSSSQKSTPKLREYFPETLVWQPELITNADGKAELKFKMADNITTWKLYTIASTKNGKFGVAEKEVQAFQPFFVDLDPPKFLTEGDEIYLPTQIRNYTPMKQKVDVTMSKSDWFTFLDSDKKQIEVDKNSAGNAVFGFKTITPVKDGKQRVTAIATKDSDAIEKPVTVRPNGEEIVRTESKLFTNSAQFEVSFPENMLPKTNKTELKIYPNLMSHVTESVEGLLQRPYGCGEQTISSTYPNLMLLKFIKSDNSLTKKAKKYLKAGYERLLGYQIADGGFSYWGGKDSSDIALTAYALRFLNDAKQFVEVDEKVIENATNYLIKQQREDGSFYKKYYWEKEEDQKRSKLFTSYVARTLAMLKTNKPLLEKALGYLKIRNAELDEPYTLALYALASFDAGNFDEAEKTVDKLQSLAKTEGDAIYWNLESNTPFYGWGTAGRIETSALVLQALIKSKNQNPKIKEQISKGTIFLLKNKDRYGVWYSTQTTINVLDTFLATLSESKAQTISVLINDEKLQDFAVSADQIEPIIIPLSDKLSSVNRVEIISSENSPIMSQIVKTHYIDWKDSVSVNRNINDSRAIKLDYNCDKLNAKIMENINCSVKAERIGFKVYGMLLAEIGIPPGANVSRESLEEAFKNDWSLSRYDILPDRIVVYMWAKAGGSKFNFSFKPRYAINAQTPASTIYDYYNEESKGVVAPIKFTVK